jgi:hypothetical protein
VLLLLLLRQVLLPSCHGSICLGDDVMQRVVGSQIGRHLQGQQQSIHCTQQQQQQQQQHLPLANDT